MNIPKTKIIAMADPFFSQEDRDLIHKELDLILSGALSMGRNVKEFENEFAVLCGVKYAIATNSCTAALEISLQSLGIGPGDEVIVPSETFIATGMAPYLVGATPIVAEISPRTFCLDLADVKKRITARTKAVIIVYMGGLIPQEILELRDLCNSKGIFLIEDAAHAPGAELQGQKAGSIGSFGCFSFYPTKVMTSGEGGMITTNSDELAQAARSRQHRGLDLSAPKEKEQYIFPGRNVRMTETTALIGRVQLSHLEWNLKERLRVVTIYKNGLQKLSKIKLILPEDPKGSSYWKIPSLLSNDVDRLTFIQKLKEYNITVDIAYTPPLHLQPSMKKILNSKEGDLPISENILAHHVCLPCHPRISDQEAHDVVSRITEVLS